MQVGITVAWQRAAPTAALALFLAPVAGLVAERPATTSVGSPHEGIVIEGGLSRSEVALGGSLRLWLTVTNPGNTPVDDVRLEPLTDLPGFAVRQLGWSSERGEQRCARASTPPHFSLDLASCAPLAPRLAAGQSVAVWGDLEALAPSGRQTLYAVVGWQGEGLGRSQVVVALGGVAVQGWWGRLLSALRGLSLPIVLAVLGLVWGWWDKKRETRRRDAEARQTEVSQTWNSMLRISHRYASKCYVPLGASLYYVLQAIDGYVDSAGAAREAGGGPGTALSEAALSRVRAAERDVFYWLMLFLRRSRYIARRVGGMYFKNRVGEELAARCYDEFYDGYTRGEEGVERNLDGILRRVGRFETRDSFLGKLDARSGATALAGLFQEGLTHLQKWLEAGERRDRGRAHLAALLAVLEYEINRPYERWYGHREVLRLRGDANQALLTLSDKIGMRPAVEAYIAEGKKPTAPA